MENKFTSEWKNLVVQIFNSKAQSFLYTVKAGETFLPNIKKACVSKQIPEAGIYRIHFKEFVDDKGYKQLYIHKADKLVKA